MGPLGKRDCPQTWTWAEWSLLEARASTLLWNTARDVTQEGWRVEGGGLKARQGKGTLCALQSLTASSSWPHTPHSAPACEWTRTRVRTHP